MADDAGFILVKGDQGLGNRILCLLSATLLARLTGRRLVIDWRDPIYSADGRDAFHRLLRVDLAVPLDALPDTDSVRPAVWRGHLHESALTVRRRRYGQGYIDSWLWEPFSVPLDRIDQRERVLVFTSFFEQIAPLRKYLTGPLAGLRRLSESAILERLWAEHLTLAPALEARVSEFRRTRFAGETLGVHVRDSDLRTRGAAILAATERLVARHPRLRIFLATDNADVVQRYTAQFGDVITTEKWYPPPGKAMHVHAERPDPTAGAADALVDMHLLAACDRLVFDSRSSFGRLAALRARAEARPVIDVNLARFAAPALRRQLLRWGSYGKRWLHDRTGWLGRSV